MGLYHEHVLPRVIDKVCANRELRRWRRRALEGLHGDVVEIGFGSGTNVALYPDTVRSVHAVEPSRIALQLAAPRIAASSIPVDTAGLDGGSIQLADASCDAAVITFTLCTVPSPPAVLREVRRVLRPGGVMHLLEHGRSPDASVARWQQRIDPIEKRVAGGCHLTRDPLEELTAAGFEPVWVDQGYAAGPKPWSWMTVGVFRVAQP